MYNVTRKEGRALPLKKVKSKQHVSKEHKSKFFNRKRREKISSGLFIAPSFLGVLIFFMVPFMVVIYYSMVDNPISGNFVFLENYANVLDNAAFKTAVRNTGVFSALAVPLAVMLSLMLATVLEAKLPFRSQFRTFFLWCLRCCSIRPLG